MSEAARRCIVVGIDASDNARQALRWAAARAEPGDVVELVHVWSRDVVAGRDPAASGGSGRETTAASAAEEAVNRLLYDTADEVLEDEDRELLDLRFTSLCGHAADELIERASGADLLVVGRRGVGGFRALLVGSVSDDVVRLAPCPVAVIPPGAP